jgi:hypothetical protein
MIIPLVLVSTCFIILAAHTVHYRLKTKKSIDKIINLQKTLIESKNNTIATYQETCEHYNKALDSYKAAVAIGNKLDDSRWEKILIEEMFLDIKDIGLVSTSSFNNELVKAADDFYSAYNNLKPIRPAVARILNLLQIFVATNEVIRRTQLRELN